MNENDFVLVISGTDYNMVDEHDDNYNFNYNLGLVFPKKNFNKFAKRTYNLYRSLLSTNEISGFEQKEKLTLTQIFDSILKNNGFDTILEYANLLTKIGLESGVKIFRSNDHKTFLERSNEITEELKGIIYSSNIVNIYRDSSTYLTELADEELSANLVLCDEKIKAYAESEFAELPQVEYFNSNEFPLTFFMDSIHALNNIAVSAANKKLYNPESYDEFNKKFLTTWGNYVFKMFYDKYEKVRNTSTQITNLIMELKNENNGNHNLKVEDDEE